MSGTLIEKYNKASRDAGLPEDPGQLTVVSHLQRLHNELSRSGAIGRGRLLRRMFGRGEEPIKGLYIWGGVGRGKTYLMDLFFSTAPVTLKTRTHFHRFMQSIHLELKQLRHTADPLSIVARDLSKRCKLLCLDEFFVLDIGDAVILAGLIEALIDNDVVIVMTSNTQPDNLYLGGIQRDRFMAAIRMINTRMDVVEIAAGTDYRLRLLSGKTLFYGSLSAQSERALRQVFAESDTEGKQVSGAIEILNRSISTVGHTHNLVWFTFSNICDGPRSKADYIEIANLYRTVIISQIPILNWERENQARRFIELVDEFYDRGVHLVASAATGIDSLYVGKRLTKEFERTASRLHEMQTDRYLSRPRSELGGVLG